MNVLDLFSGIGGFSLGLHRAGFKTVALCEIEKFQQAVLAKNFPGVPIFSNIKTLTREKLNELGINQIDLVCGGFPCQPYSTAGKQKAFKDDRDLWPEMFRVIAETRPTWVIGENVSGFVNLGFTRTKVDLESIGYTVRPFVIPACAVGAQHRRDRIWIIAHLNREQLRGESIGERGRSDSRIAADFSKKGVTPHPLASGREGEMHGRCEQEHAFTGCVCDDGTSSDSNSDGLARQAASTSEENNERERQGDGWSARAADFGNWWADQSCVGRAVYGVTRELDKNRWRRVGALGNSVVPQIPEIIGRFIMQFEEGKK